MPTSRFSVLLLLPVLALAACRPDLEPGPIVDLVGSARLVTNDRRLSGPADTLAVRMYARRQGDAEPALQRLRITVNYRPTFDPVTYELPYNPDDPPLSSLLYADSLLNAGRDVAFQSVLQARTTAGLETWEYEVTDAEGRIGRRNLRLRLLRADSALVYHSYTLSLQALGPITTRRSFLALRQGLALPRFTVLAQEPRPGAQQLIDLVYVPTATGPVLATPTDAGLNLPASRWPQKRATEIRSIAQTTFNDLATAAALTTAFNTGTPFTTPTRTSPLRPGQMLAFRTPEGKSGALRVEAVSAAGVPTLTVQVRVTK